MKDAECGKTSILCGKKSQSGSGLCHLWKAEALLSANTVECPHQCRFMAVNFLSAVRAGKGTEEDPPFLPFPGRGQSVGHAGDVPPLVLEFLLWFAPRPGF
jgi:hypothetical protein